MARDPAVLASSLIRYLKNGERITGVVTLSAGHSNETYLVEGLDLILRMAPSTAPLLPDALDIKAQHDTFAAMSGADSVIPVPAPTLMETDGRILGSPFFLMQRVDALGWDDWAIPAWASSADDSVRDTIFRQAVAALSHLHRRPLLEMFGAVRSTTAELSRWRTMAEGRGFAALDAAFDLLARTAPADIAAAPCHGDPKLANMLWRADGKMAALLDWELAFNGDPRWDVAYLLSCLDSAERPGRAGFDQSGFWDRDRVVAAWEEGTRLSATRLLWFDAAVKAKVGAIMAYGFWMTVAGLSDDERFRQWDATAVRYGEGALHLAELDAARL